MAAANRNPPVQRKKRAGGSSTNPIYKLQARDLSGGGLSFKATGVTPILGSDLTGTVWTHDDQTASFRGVNVMKESIKSVRKVDQAVKSKTQNMKWVPDRQKIQTLNAQKVAEKAGKQYQVAKEWCMPFYICLDFLTTRFYIQMANSYTAYITRIETEDMQGRKKQNVMVPADNPDSVKPILKSLKVKDKDLTKFSSGHDVGGSSAKDALGTLDKSDSPTMKPEQADYLTKLIGEGARFKCVEDNVGKVSDSFVFYTSGKIKEEKHTQDPVKKHLYHTTKVDKTINYGWPFETLWKRWVQIRRLAGKEYGIENQYVKQDLDNVFTQKKDDIEKNLNWYHKIIPIDMGYSTLDVRSKKPSKGARVG